MKSHLMFGIVSCALAVARLNSAQDFEVSWAAIAGGGGRSSAGGFSIFGTFGQFDAGKLAGGDFQLDAGFWPGALGVQMAPPMLRIERSGDNLVISWNSAETDFVLQETETLTPSAWADSASDASNPVNIKPNLKVQFYRLIRR